LTGLQTAARDFEDALQDLRSRETLSGSDFLPLAVKLDAPVWSICDGGAR